MTLATTCPVCKTSFKVIPDQLKLRRGLVRCGSCHTVFSGIDHLRQVNDELGPGQLTDAAEIPPENAPDLQPEEPAVAALALEIPAAMQAPQEDAIEFFSESAQRRIRWWPRSALGKTLAIVLLVTLSLQLALALRSEIVARFPSTRAALEALAQPLGLKVELPRNPRKITIEIDLSIGEAPGMYRMNALLRSHTDTALQWPAVEISLTDANGATVVRRVLMPNDYLADRPTIVAGLPGRSEQNLRVDFLLRDVVLTGYSAVLFYP